LADEALSTGGIVKYVENTPASEIIVGTELGLIHRLQKNYPHKKIYLATNKLICPNMKLTTLEKVAVALEEMKYRITVPEDIRLPAKKAIEQMLAL